MGAGVLCEWGLWFSAGPLLDAPGQRMLTDCGTAPMRRQMAMRDLLPSHLELGACPHCGISRPNLRQVGDSFATHDHTMGAGYRWATYACSSCGKVTLAYVEGKMDGPRYQEDIKFG